MPFPCRDRSRIKASHPNDGDQEDTPTQLDELTLGGLLSVVLHGENLGQFFQNTFGHNRDLVRNQLEPVREIRNKVFHFRDEVSADELELLVGARKWLIRKVLTVGGKR